MEVFRNNFNWLIPKNSVVRASCPRTVGEITALRPDVIVLDKSELIKEPLWQKEPVICNGNIIKLVAEVVSKNWQDDYAIKV
ncbi:hypothetical protein [Okeania sp.]|uniref:hypothetical protein n=1 Tax=Okeania sp. TaxID=3100323 RepID=UPI002B4ACEFC|nr:hypothetical protein [Okeania sp.]MEB3340666.1 hypothetical protein [Okeania sp.]